MLKEKCIYCERAVLLVTFLGMGPRKAPVKLSLYCFSVDLFVRSYSATHTAEGGEIMVKHVVL